MTMNKVWIKSITTHCKWEDYEETEVIVNGEVLFRGNYGGEPEDNRRCRTYSWVERALEKLAVKLGAEVIVVYKDVEETDE